MAIESFINNLTLFSSFYVSVILSIAAVLLFVVYKRNKFDVWEKQGVKGPKPLPFIGNSAGMLLNASLADQIKRHKMYGQFYGFYDGTKPMLSVIDPEILRYIMVKDSDVFINRRPNQSSDPILKNLLTSLRDEKWKRTRAIMSPTFTSGKIKKMTSIINGCVKSLRENIESKVKSNQEIDVKALYGSFTMDVIASCAFATKTNAYKNPNDPFVVNAKEFFSFRTWRIFVHVFIPKFLRKLLNFNVVPSSVVEFFKTSTKAIIKQRKNNNVMGNDFMQLLLDSEDSTSLLQVMKDINAEQINNENQEEIESNSKLLMTDDNSKLTEDEILAQCLIFFVAGYETTAALLSYTTYALAMNAECQELLYKEVKQHLETGGEISYETINKMKYLNAVINETLRLYTPVIRVDRDTSRDYKLPTTDVIIPKGTNIVIPLYVIHHDENNYPEPYAFKPERFLPENIDEIKPYTFLPFGSGPRNCIGMRFALMEAKMALCNIILSYKFLKSENTDEPLRMKRLAIGLLPVERVLLRFESRNQ